MDPTAVELDAAPHQHLHPRCTGLANQLLDEPRFPDARLAADQRRDLGSGRDALERVAERELLRAVPPARG